MKIHRNINSLVVILVFVLLHISPYSFDERGDDYYKATISNNQLLALIELRK